MRRARTMLLGLRRVRQRLKSLMPTHLFPRTLLILMVPMVVSQLMVAHIFYTRHWQSVARNMSSSAAGDVAVLVREYHFMLSEQGPKAARMRMWRMGQAMNIDIAFFPLGTPFRYAGHGRTEFPEFYAGIDGRIAEPFGLYSVHDGRDITMRMALDGQRVDMTLSRKRIASSTTSIFMFWMLGSSLLLITIAALFLRNQIRPVVQLARVAEQLGLGHDVEDFTPRGANEIRRAGRAFLTMADRIRRHVTSRTEMLAGISHDLRTPLTRMKLELELGGVPARTADAINADIDHMNHMIDGYLAFARGDAGEAMEMVPIAEFLGKLCETYQRQGAPVELAECPSIGLMMRPNAMHRALSNLIDNALRYGGEPIQLQADYTMGLVRIKIRDHGVGIPESEMERVFKPFTRLEHSRNTATGGVGLGMSIALDVIQHHGGSITLENLRHADGKVLGLEVTVRLPREIRASAPATETR